MGVVSSQLLCVCVDFVLLVVSPLLMLLRTALLLRSCVRLLLFVWVACVGCALVGVVWLCVCVVCYLFVVGCC